MYDNLSCERCGFTASTRKYLIQHLRRKTLCRPVVSEAQPSDQLDRILPSLERNHVCDACNKAFTCATNMHRHKRTTCEKKPKAKKELSEVADLKKEIKELKSMVEELKNTPSNVYNNCTINNNLNVFGNENISHWTEDQSRFKRFVVKCVEGNIEGACNFLMKKHFSPQNPSNHNMRKTNKKDDTIRVVNNEKKWVHENCDKVLAKAFNSISTDFAVLDSHDLQAVSKNRLYTFYRTTYMPLAWDIKHWKPVFDAFDLEDMYATSFPYTHKCYKRIMKRAKELVYLNTQNLSLM